MKGIAYGVGVGSGDPELMTLKSIRIIKENNVIAVPGKVAENSIVYKIALQNIPELAEKEIIALYMPMVKDRNVINNQHIKNADIIKSYLDKGQNVVYLTLGDPTIYCSFSYLQSILQSNGYQVEIVNGIPSFCAVASRLSVSLAEWNEEIHIIPTIHKQDDFSIQSGTYVFMKSSSNMDKVKKIIVENDLQAVAVENCGMKNENIYLSVNDIPDNTGYFSIVVAKSKKFNPQTK